MFCLQNPKLLKHLVASFLFIKPDDIKDLVIVESKIAPQDIEGKYCHLDINMKIDEKLVDVEVQVVDEGNYRERSLFYWSDIAAGTVPAGKDYIIFPRIFLISILAFKLFERESYYSEYTVQEATDHELLNDKLNLLFFELEKYKEIPSPEDSLSLWLSLFKAKTEEDLNQIRKLDVPIMTEAIETFNHIINSEEFKTYQRIRKRAQRTEVLALGEAKNKGRKEGLKEGLKEGHIEVALKLLKRRQMELSEILEVAGLTKEELTEALKLRGEEKWLPLP
jgi:predicted transposase/invertase (TIGR01784 family)